MDGVFLLEEIDETKISTQKVYLYKYCMRFFNHNIDNLILV